MRIRSCLVYGVGIVGSFLGLFMQLPGTWRDGFWVRNAMKSWFLPVRSFLFLSNYRWAWPFGSFLYCETGQRVGVRTEGEYLFIYCPLWISWAQEAVYCSYGPKKTKKKQSKAMMVSWCYEVSWHRVKNTCWNRWDEEMHTHISLHWICPDVLKILSLVIWSNTRKPFSFPA